MRPEGLTPTIHNAAKYGDIAKTVLMPGDPRRAEYIAKNYLTDAMLLSEIRGICCYTGKYRGESVTVMASGMGAGSMSIYSYELFHFYDVDTIVRVGSAGGLHPSLKLMDIFGIMASSTDCGYASHFELPGNFAPCADFSLLYAAKSYAEQNGIRFKAGPAISGEGFYYSDEWFRKWAAMGVMAVEMESAALYMNAAEAGKHALALCTISDLMFSGEKCTPEQREKNFDNMIKMALEISSGL